MDTKHQQLVAMALESFERGEIAFAETIARRFFVECGESAELWNMLGRLALKVDRPRHAIDAFEKALAINPYLKVAGKNLKAARAAATVPLSPEPVTPRYLLIRAWGHGFWSDVDHVMGGLLLAEVTGRTPIVHWGSESLFSIDPAGNAWTDFFEPVNELTLGDVRGRGFDFFPARWNDDNLHEPHHPMYDASILRPASATLLDRPERVCVANYHLGIPMIRPWIDHDSPLFGHSVLGLQRYVKEKYLRVRHGVAAPGEELARTRFAGGRLVAAHVRGSDKQDESAEAAHFTSDAIVEVAAMLEGNDARLFLMTDSEPAREEFVKRFGDRVITADALRTSSSLGLHLQGLQDRTRLGAEVIRDVMLAAKAERFVGLGWSNVSCAVRFWKDWPAGACTLLGKVVQESMNITSIHPGHVWEAAR